MMLRKSNELVTFAFMDSITQLVLGAACGEIALGKKIGNKAILFGAIGGTIPDLDVIIGNLFYSNEIDRLAFHRGFMHSFIFAFLAALIIGFITSEIYNSSKLRKGTTHLKDWVWLFFLSICTHPILDSFTPYGTQLFSPFTNYRVAFNTISVADPLYTVPFLICLIVAMFFNRKNPMRRKWTKAGIYISSAYLIFTIGNKIYIDRVFDTSFKKATIKFNRFSAQPTILNNLLWYGVAETDSAYYATFYSIFDKQNNNSQFVMIPKNHDLLDMNHPDLKTLRWFSDNFYVLSTSLHSDEMIYRDVRYPLLDIEDQNSFLFSFILQKEKDRWNTKKLDKEPFQDKDFQGFFTSMFDRALRDF